MFSAAKNRPRASPSAGASPAAVDVDSSAAAAPAASAAFGNLKSDGVAPRVFSGWAV